VAIEIVFETHSTTVDNEKGKATGWAPGELSDPGREQAEEMGLRRRDDGLAVIFTSDLARAVQTVGIAFAGVSIPVLHDWRLRECDYGQRTGMPVSELHATRREHLDVPYPGGESWRQAVTRVGRFLADVRLRWAGQRILVVGHVATRWGLDHFIDRVRLEDLADRDFAWQPGWEYRLKDLSMRPQAGSDSADWQSRWTIDAGRVTLQPVTREMAQAVLDGGPITRRFAEGAMHDRIPQAMGFAIRDIDSGAAAVVPTVWLVIRTADGQIIGDLGTHGPADSEGCVEIGFALAPSERGKGTGTAAVSALVGRLATVAQIRQLIAVTGAENTASRRLLERVGFRETGPAPGADDVRYGLILT
jgi:broad specificity phosphatase PhoE